MRLSVVETILRIDLMNSSNTPPPLVSGKTIMKFPADKKTTKGGKFEAIEDITDQDNETNTRNSHQPHPSEANGLLCDL